MIVQEALKECNLKELLENTINIITLYDGCLLTDEEISTGSDQIINSFLNIDPKFDLSNKFKLLFKSDGFGPYCVLQYKNYTETISDYNFFNENKLEESGIPRYVDVLNIPWDQLSGLECEFCKEVNGLYLEHLFAFFFLDLSCFLFDEPMGEEVDLKLKNLLDLP